MHRTDGANHVANAFSDGGSGVPGTFVEEAWLNAVQGELCYLIEQCGITLVKGTNTQLHAALFRGGTPAAGANWAVVGGLASVRRVVGIVSFSVQVSASAGAAFTSVFTLPVDFRPSLGAFLWGEFVDNSTGLTHAVRINVDSAGVGSAVSYDNGTSLVAMPALGAGDTIVVTGSFPV